MKINLSSFLQWRFNIFLCKALGWRITFSYMNFLGKLYFFFNKKEKWKIEKSIETVFMGRKNRSEIRSVTRYVFRGILSHYHEKIFNAYSTAETLRAFFETHAESKGMDAIEQGLSRGKGVLLLSGHYGGVEFIPIFLGAKNYPVTIVAKFKTDDLRNRTLQQAEKFSINIIDAYHTPNIIRAIFKDLRENRIVITLCDEIDEWRPCRQNRIRFLGKQIQMDRTINLLSKRCGAAVVFGVMHRDFGHRYTFIATSLEEMAKRFQRSQDMSIGAVVLKCMEDYIYKHPEGWYQWKKYPALNMFSPAGNDITMPSASPLLKPSLGTAS
ncbi:MAG: lysophospholipid acyltransferase family protein [Deltaproteobacteria bacterium]|nr:lysophospholipid acyltransferase family protein [Deltaproteobacteria bacterium]